MHRFLRIEYWGIYAIRLQPAKGHPKWWQDKQQIAATALAIKQYFSPYAEGGGWKGKRSEGGHAYLLKLINCLKMTETTANGKTQNVIFRNFCCISVLSQSFFLFFFFFFAFLSFGLFVFLILFVCLRKSPARRCTFCSNERLYKPCELRAVSWSRQPALEVIAVAKLSIQLKQMSCCCWLRNELGFVFGQKMHRIRVSWQRKRQTAAGCTSFNANDLEKKT